MVKRLSAYIFATSSLLLFPRISVCILVISLILLHSHFDKMFSQESKSSWAWWLNKTHNKCNNEHPIPSGTRFKNCYWSPPFFFWSNRISFLCSPIVCSQPESRYLCKAVRWSDRLIQWIFYDASHPMFRLLHKHNANHPVSTKKSSYQRPRNPQLSVLLILL